MWMVVMFIWTGRWRIHNFSERKSGSLSFIKEKLHTLATRMQIKILLKKAIDSMKYGKVNPANLMIKDMVELN